MANKGRYAKMRLIPEDEYERLKQKIVKEYDPRLAAMVTASDQAVLPTGVPRDPAQLKFQLTQYQHAMDTFKTLKNNKHVATLPEIKHELPVLTPPAPAHPPPHPPPEPHAALPLSLADDAGAAAEFLSDEAEDVEPGSAKASFASHPIFLMALESVPGNYRRKAEQSLEYIKLHPEKINVNKDLELIVDGVPKQGTNFIDLFASLYKAPSSKKSSILPTYHSQFRNLLSEINMPNTYLPAAKPQTGKGYPPGRHPHILHVYK